MRLWARQGTRDKGQVAAVLEKKSRSSLVRTLYFLRQISALGSEERSWMTSRRSPGVTAFFPPGGTHLYWPRINLYVGLRIRSGTPKHHLRINVLSQTAGSLFPVPDAKPCWIVHKRISTLFLKPHPTTVCVSSVTWLALPSSRHRCLHRSFASQSSPSVGPIKKNKRKKKVPQTKTQIRGDHGLLNSSQTAFSGIQDTHGESTRWHHRRSRQRGRHFQLGSPHPRPRGYSLRRGRLPS